MSSPFIQSVTSSAPFRVCGDLVSRALPSPSDQISTSSTSNGWPTPRQVILCRRFTIILFDAFDWSDHSSVQIVRIQSAHLPGYNAAIASSLRDGPIRGLHDSFEKLGASDRKILLIWVSYLSCPSWHTPDGLFRVPRTTLYPTNMQHAYKNFSRNQNSSLFREGGMT